MNRLDKLARPRQFDRLLCLCIGKLDLGSRQLLGHRQQCTVSGRQTPLRIDRFKAFQFRDLLGALSQRFKATLRLRQRLLGAVLTRDHPG